MKHYVDFTFVLMNNRWLFLCFLLCLSVCSNAQINLTVKVPDTEVQRENQLWNLELELLGEDSLFVDLRLRLMRVNNDTTYEVMTASTGYHNLKKGTKYSSKELVLLRYDFDDLDFRRAYVGTSRLPAGDYLACYSAVEMSWKNRENPTLVEKAIKVKVKQ